MIEPDKIRSLLLGAFADAQIELRDLTGTRDHYECHIASDKFRGLSPIAQHKLVYGALGAEMHGPIHALALKTYTLDAWQKRAR
jgi:stress-induced morphogen